GLGAKVILLVREEELTLEQTIAVEDYQAQSSPTARLLLQHGVRAALVAGLWAESQRVGGLAVASAQPRHWSEGEITLVKVLGKQLGALIERARLQAEVEQHSRQLEQIMATVPQGVALLDADLHVLEANPVAREALELLGWPQGAEPVLHLGGRPTTELLAPPPRGRWHELQAQGRTLEFLAHPLAEGLAVMGWVLILVDVTEERETQRRGLQQDRLAAVGRLAAGVAHDFNNILTVILLQATLSLDQPDLPLSLRERLTAISRQTQRASELVRQILDFSRRSMLEQRTMDLVPFLQEQVRILQRVLPETIQVQLTCSQDELLITADPTRIQQVVMNLAVNARDAMPDGGRLHLGLDRVPALPRHLQSDRALTGTGAGKPFVGEEGQWARLTVSDSGTGMASEVLSHLFEPFFTTKEVGQGTGLGLAQVHGIVKQHGGEIEVQTTPGEGTSFIIYLPALPVSRTTDQPSEAQPVPQGQGETILIVEDDASVRQVLVNSVERLQYRVLAAASGQEALALLEQHAEVALVLSDLIMPAMGGKELLRAIRERGLHLPVVLLSGYPLDSDLPDMQALGLAGWLLKPPDGAELARALAQALSPRS
ncbi:MAG: response regulator, partial [Chloroflexi bacterium]|nr:response regulator [Chloroflexota bacterium]